MNVAREEPEILPVGLVVRVALLEADGDNELSGDAVSADELVPVTELIDVTDASDDGDPLAVENDVADATAVAESDPDG